MLDFALQGVDLLPPGSDLLLHIHGCLEAWGGNQQKRRSDAETERVRGLITALHITRTYVHGYMSDCIAGLQQGRMNDICYLIELY